MNIAITLVHNKTDAENAAQIETLKGLIKEVIDGPFTNPDTGEVWTTIHHELKNVNIPHELKIYQVVPFGVTPPANRYDINSGGIVQFGIGDEDKIDTHPRFFNWSLKRGTDNGAAITILLEDVNKFTPQKLIGKLQRLADKNDTTEYDEDDYGKLATLELLKKVGQLKEDRGMPAAITELKQRIVGKGLKHG